jgi:hypothetical protein
MTVDGRCIIPVQAYAAYPGPYYYPYYYDPFWYPPFAVGFGFGFHGHGHFR